MKDLYLAVFLVLSLFSVENHSVYGYQKQAQGSTNIVDLQRNNPNSEISDNSTNKNNSAILKSNLQSFPLRVGIRGVSI
jgi:hypothetical protein